LVGWFIEVRDQRGRLLEEFDGLTKGEPSTLKDVLDVLVRRRFFSREDLQLALTQLHFGFDPEEIEGGEDDGARRAAAVVQQLKQAAGE